MNENHNKVPLYTHEDDYDFSKGKVTSIGEVVEKLEPLFIAGGNARGCLCGKYCGSSPRS